MAPKKEPIGEHSNRMFELCKQNGITIKPAVCIFVMNEEHPIDEYGLSIEQPIPLVNAECVLGQKPDTLTTALLTRLNTLFDEAVKKPTKEIPLKEIGQDGKEHKIEGKFTTTDSNEVWAWRKAKQAVASLLFPEAMKQARDIYKEAHKKHEKTTIANLERRIMEEQEKARQEREQAQRERQMFMDMMKQFMSQQGAGQK